MRGCGKCVYDIAPSTYLERPGERQRPERSEMVFNLLVTDCNENKCISMSLFHGLRHG